VLARGGPSEIPRGAEPEAQCLCRIPARSHVFVLVGERLFDVTAELRAELERKQAQQAPIVK
jgi:hypothetical protein